MIVEGKHIIAAPREQVFVTTKLWNDDQGYDGALRAFDASLQRLGLDYEGVRAARPDM